MEHTCRIDVKDIEGLSINLWRESVLPTLVAYL